MRWVLPGLFLLVLGAGGFPGVGGALALVPPLRTMAKGDAVQLCANTAHPSRADMQVAAAVIRRRLAALGIADARVHLTGTHCIRVAIAGGAKNGLIIRTMVKTGYVAITDAATGLHTSAPDPGETVKLACKTAACGAPGARIGHTNLASHPPILQVVVPDKDIRLGSARMSYDQAGNAVVTYAMTGAGSHAWRVYTTTHVNHFSPIVVDNKVISDPVIQQAICSGQTQITGLTASSARQIVTYLNSGALPFGLHARFPTPSPLAARQAGRSSAGTCRSSRARRRLQRSPLGLPFGSLQLAPSLSATATPAP